MSAPEQIERLCEVMHDAYEKAALGAGWQTQEASRKPWAEVPEANKATMRAAVVALLDSMLQGSAARVSKAIGATREFQAGAAFGVPADARALYLDALTGAAISAFVAVGSQAPDADPA